MTREEKKLSRWEKFLEPLTGAAQRALTGQDTSEEIHTTAKSGDQRQFEKFIEPLTGPARAAIVYEANRGAEPPAEKSELIYFLVENFDGELGTVRAFKTPEALAQRMGELFGQDAQLIPGRGTILKFTRGPQPALLLQDGKTAVSIPIVPGMPVRKFDADLLGPDVEIQEDWYVGTDALTKSTVQERAKAAKPTEDDDDDFDEDDEFVD